MIYSVGIPINRNIVVLSFKSLKYSLNISGFDLFAKNDADFFV